MNGRMLLPILGFCAALAADAGDAPLPRRWVFVTRGLTADSHVEDIDQLTATAAAHGLNGMVLSGNLESVGRWDAARLQRLEAVRALCDKRGIELIPLVWSVGYGTMLGIDPHLAAGIPCRGVPFTAGDGVARFTPETDSPLRNGNFEDARDHVFDAFAFHDRPGEVSFVDTDVRAEGKASIRFEGFGRYEHGHARVMQEIRVRPHRQYRIRCAVKTDALAPTDAFKIQVYGPKGCIAPRDFPLRETEDWREVEFLFNSGTHESLRLYAGLWGGKSGRIWLDNLRVEPVALAGLLRRPGTPIRVVREADGIEFTEGVDFVPPVEKVPAIRTPPADTPEIAIPPGSRIVPGDRLLVDYYHGAAVNRSQVSVCMSEPRLYELWQESAAAVAERVRPRTWLLSMDEIRAGGSCAACKARNLTLGEILGDCITRQAELIRAVTPDAEIAIWSDMLDPNHNAHADYYLAEGDFAGSWKHIPKDLIIACWYFDKRKESMRFFSGEGFRTLAAAYYDGDDLTNVRGWLETARRTSGCRGIMYTTWQNKYDLLAPFGDLVTGQTP